MAGRDGMTDGELLAEVGTDAQQWATFFCDKFVVRDYTEPSGEFDDVALMTTWFANSIMAGYDEAKADEATHSRRLVEALRHIANNCDHAPMDDDQHIHEPTTGGVTHCAPCYAWRFLNGSPDAL